MDRKEAIKQFKERKPYRGVYSIRSTVSGSVWVGATPDLRAAQNSNWFSLRIGSHRDPELQKQWNAQGESAFEFEVREALDEDIAAMSVRDLLKEKKAHWSTELNARPLL